MSIILVFDDLAEEQEELVGSLKGMRLRGAKVVPFDGDTTLQEEASFEKHISDWIEKELADDIGLVVCDKELGRYRQLKGLSATSVSAVALQKGIPFCQYSRQASKRDFALFERLRRWRSEEITLDGLEPKDWAPKIKSLFDGFERLRVEYAKLSKQRGTPASALATILGHPDSESRIALYGSGDQGFLKEVFAFHDLKKPDLKALCRRMPRVLGNWLFLSILRFPGILVNGVAAASYLNIDCRDFKKREIMRQFRSAQYNGPFSDLGPWWWRSTLDDIINEAKCEDGRAYVLSKSHRVRQSLDEQSRKRAGYYCMLMQAPVAADNSRGGISWFPAGADLARIRKDKFDQITSLVGLY